MSVSEPNLLIIGASTRAAAFSAKRAGYRPLCLDLFADLDLQANAVVHRIANYPHGLIETLKSLPRFPLLYVGGLENQLEVLQVAGEFHDLLGNSPEVVAAARNPAQLTEAIRLAQVVMPEWRSAENPPEQDETWILRPLFGSGGRGIQLWNEAAAESSVLQEPHGFQKRISGTPYSAAYVASGEQGDIKFVGVTEQLIGSKLSAAEKFQWGGNIGPTTLSIPVEHKMRRVGNLLKWKLGLKGLFGVDFLVNDNEEVFVTEVNPRYPGSLELLEFATGQLLLDTHIQCFAKTQLAPKWEPAAQGPLFGKAILYADNAFTLNIDFSEEIPDYSEFPMMADLPPIGTSFQIGEPICTLFAEGKTVQECRELISTKLASMRERLAMSI